MPASHGSLMVLTDTGKYCAGYAISTPMDVVEVVPWPLVTTAQQAELYALTQACTLTQGKTANIDTDSRYTFGMAHDFGILWKCYGFLTSRGDEIKNGPYVQGLLDAILLPAGRAIIKILGHSQLDCLEAKGNHLADTSTRNAALNGTNSHQISVMAQRDISLNDHLEKLAREAQQLASEREKQGWKFNNCWFDKKRKLYFRPNNNPVLLETLKFSPLTTVHALNHWSTDKMIAFMNQYWWGNSKKAAKSTYLTCPIYPKHNPGKLVCNSGQFKLPNGPLEVWQMDFIQFLPSRGCKYVLVMVCMFSHWTEGCHCRQAAASSVAKVLLEKIIPTQGTPLKLHSVQGTHFTGQVLRHVCAVWPVS